MNESLQKDCYLHPIHKYQRLFDVCQFLSTDDGLHYLQERTKKILNWL
jgi:hypothetical protein